MKKLILLILAAALCLGVAACSSAAGPAEEAGKIHQIGVIVYNLGDEEVIGIREYLQGYIEQNFEMVKFVYSGAVTTPEEEMAFIRDACDSGVEGFMSFRTFDLAAEVALCEENRAYYMLASGTVSDEEFAAVEDNPWFLGVFGPGREAEYEVGADMARHFEEDHPGQRYFILSGGAPLGNEMHLQRTIGILETILGRPEVNFTGSVEKLAASPKLNSYTCADLTVTVCPGYITRDASAFQTARDTLSTGNYDAALFVLPPGEMVNHLGTALLGVVDSYNARNFQLFADGRMHYLAGKYSSVVGPAFALMLNAVTGHAADFRDNGKAVKVKQQLWVSCGAADYNEKYALSSSAAMNAYNFDDLSQVCCLFNPDANLAELIALAEASSYEDVLARRSRG